MLTLSVSEAKARLNELARLVHTENARLTLTRNGKPEAVLLSIADLESLEMTIEVLADRESVTTIAAALAALAAGEPTVPLNQLRKELRTRSTGIGG